jgi:hypothetical protein
VVDSTGLMGKVKWSDNVIEKSVRQRAVQKDVAPQLKRYMKQYKSFA